MYILTILAWPIKIYIYIEIDLSKLRFFESWRSPCLNQISVEMSFTIKEYSFPL